MPARELDHAGRRVLLLEARDSLGGRAYTSHLGESGLALCGAFAHWFQPPLVAEVTHYGLSLRVPPEQTRWSVMALSRPKDVLGTNRCAILPNKARDA